MVFEKLGKIMFLIAINLFCLQNQIFQTILELQTGPGFRCAYVLLERKGETPYEQGKRKCEGGAEPLVCIRNTDHVRRYRIQAVQHQGYGCEQSNLIAIMQEMQGEYKYLSEEALMLVAEKLGISTAKVYSVATFYENFSLEAKGRHIIKVCAGTACHVRKSQPIYDAIRDYLGLTGKKKTSADGMFTLETVACLGACGLAPVMTIDGEVHAKMTPEAALELLERMRKEEAE